MASEEAIEKRNRLVEELKREHGEVFEISACGYEFVVRVPTEAECDRFNDSAAKERAAKSSGTRALGQLVRDVIVHPTSAECDAIFARRPMLPTTLGNEVVKIAGLSDEVSVKKA